MTYQCACWPNLRPYNTHKLLPRSSQCVFLSYSLLHKGYKCLHLPSNRLYISRDVVFDETTLPFQKSSPPILSESSPPHQILAMVQSISTSGLCTVPTRVPASPPHGPALETSTQANFPNQPKAHATPQSPQALTNVVPASSTHGPAHTTSTQADFLTPPEAHNPPTQTQALTTTAPDKSPTRVPIPNLTPETSTRCEPPSTHKPADPPLPPTHPMTTRSQNQINKPKIPTNGTVRYPVPKALLAVSKSSSIDAEPTCFTSVVKSPTWRKAMNLEFDALLKNQTWQLVPPHPSQNLIGCKWVF